jgi:hypothetical protein
MLDAMFFLLLLLVLSVHHSCLYCLFLGLLREYFVKHMVI